MLTLSLLAGVWSLITNRSIRVGPPYDPERIILLPERTSNVTWEVAVTQIPGNLNRSNITVTLVIGPDSQNLVVWLPPLDLGGGTATGEIHHPGVSVARIVDDGDGLFGFDDRFEFRSTSESYSLSGAYLCVYAERAIRGCVWLP